MKINILGTEYTVFKYNKDDDNRLSNKDGFCDFYAKEIVVSKQEDDINDIDRCRNLIEYEKKCLRHEIIHAFFYESGLAHNSNTIDTWAKNEEMVDWIAIQFPKILEVFKKANCL